MTYRDKKAVFENVRKLKRMCIEHLGGNCKRCGLRDDVTDVYDFHHIGERDHLISKLISSRSQRKVLSEIPPEILEELIKCELVCSNCHRKIHYEIKRNRVEQGLATSDKIKGRPPNIERLKMIEEMYANGASAVTIAKQLKCSRANVYFAIEKARRLSGVTNHA